MRSTSAPVKARIYNLHPLLAGKISQWPAHFPRIQSMGFDWVYINAFFEPGQSTSIYAVGNPYELHPAIRPQGNGSATSLVAQVCEEAKRHELGLLTDLILPHAAIDGTLVHDKPHWFKRRGDGSLISPQLANPVDPFHPHTMADLAEIQFLDEFREEQLSYFAALAEHYLDLGFGGFRCSAAYKVPGEFWRDLIARLKGKHPSAVFIAAALGCPIEQVQALETAKFDFIFDSSFWWNFRDPWFLEQLPLIQQVAATIAFPEDHNTGRLADVRKITDTQQIEALYKNRYFAALFLGTGVLMPMGFEFGVTEPLARTPTETGDWGEQTSSPRIDIREFIAAANSLKDSVPTLADRTPVTRISSPNGPLVGLLRSDRQALFNANEATILALNPSEGRPVGTDIHAMITATGGRFEAFEDMTPLAEPKRFDATIPLSLDPLEARLFRSRSAKAIPPQPRTRRASEKHLQELATCRVAIEKVAPELDGGRFPVKRVVGDVLTVEADIFADGHDKIAACLAYRPADSTSWSRVPMAFVDNDRWAGSFPLTRNIRYDYTIEAWRDEFASWCYEIGKKHDAGLNLSLELEEGRQLVRRTSENSEGADREAFALLLKEIDACKDDHGFQLAQLLSDDTKLLMERCDLRENLSRYDKELEVTVDRTLAAYAAWYELFPRSQSDDPRRHGTFDDVIEKLPYVEDMGFDVLYFPPIHPIGRTNRKGRNNSLTPSSDDPGSPYAIGADEGGHDALHPELGSFDDFRRLIEAASDHGLEIAIDFAINCSPDHPWLKSHPDWFDWRPDGSLKYAENPPKKYEDITNVSFYREGALPSLWYEMRDVILFWVEQGVKIFRVDNPHTKPLPFWEWMLFEVQSRHPETMFLSEAFTRPKMMKRLAKLGFTQSYSYFTWRNTKAELQEYLIELTQDEPREHMRPNFFVNTPDINPVYLQTSGIPGFKIRVLLASTLSPLYGVYSGFELGEASAVPGKEEYLNSEKYEIKAWDWDRPGNIRADIRRLNHIRRDNPALWQFTNLEFHVAHNDHIMVYSKFTESCDNAVLIAVNLDPHQAHGATFEVPLWKFDLDDHASLEVDDLVSGNRFTWTGKTQHVWLDPLQQPYMIWRLIPPGLPG